MKNIIFFIVIAVFILGGGYFFMRKNNSAPVLFTSNEIAPVEQWKDILIGEWEFKAEYKSDNNIYLLKGKVEYKKDSTFERYVHIDMYNVDANSKYKVKAEREDLLISGGGKISGNWKIGETFFIEYFNQNECFINETFIANHANKDFKLCGYFFKEYVKFGTFKVNEGEFKITKFTQNEIVIEGKLYSDETIVLCIFNRVK